MGEEKKDVVVNQTAAPQDVVVTGQPVSAGKSKLESQHDAKAAQAEKQAQAAIDDANEHQAERAAEGAAAGLKASLEPPEELPVGATDPDVASFILGDSSVTPGPEPKIAYYEHPGKIRGYEVLDLTSPYNQSRTDAPVPGFFRVQKANDPDHHQDVVTDGPYYRYGHQSRLTKASEQLINAAIDKLEAERKEK